MTTTLTAPPAKPTLNDLLGLSHDAAREFFLKPESYCSVDLPPYMGFHGLLDAVRASMGDRPLSEVRASNPRECDGVNYTILNNKDGKYSWRPFELIHPALYVSLVGNITEQAQWGLIVARFMQFAVNARIRCLSLPAVSESAEKDKAKQITRWWQEVEQRSIELSLDYEYVIETDITDCYGAIYTHSIAWALHGKQHAKDNRRDGAVIGNVIDCHIQDMRHGQTNGIPQGSVLMDFIAEMVLGLSDAELSEKIEAAKIADYRIIRYRDDYRIFVNNPQDGAQIVKLLTEVTSGLGLKLNAAKTRTSDDVVRSSIKADKLAWLSRKQSEKGLQKHLLIIHDHAARFPNSGSLVSALGGYHKRLVASKKIHEEPLPLIAIVADIAYRNPRAHAHCAAILSTLMQHVGTAAEKSAIVGRIKRRFSQIPNTGLMQIWLQRVTHPFNSAIAYEEPLCKLVAGDPARMWNSDWISSASLKAALDSEKVIDRDLLAKIAPVISEKEIELFTSKAMEGYYG